MRYESSAYINVTPPYTTTVQRTNALRKSYQMYILCAARDQLCECENAGTYKEIISRMHSTFLMTSMGKKLAPDEIHPPRDFIQAEALDEDKTKNKGLAHASILHCLSNTVFSPKNTLEYSYMHSTSMHSWSVLQHSSLKISAHICLTQYNILLTTCKGFVTQFHTTC